MIQEAGLISVVIPCWNDARFLPPAFDSIIKQTYPKVEIIVVDDGSTQLSECEEVCAQWHRHLALQLFQIDHSGAAVARNIGFTKSKGEFLFFMDADVILRSHCLQTLADALKNDPKAAYAFCSLEWINGSGGVVRTHGAISFDINRLKRQSYFSTMALIRYGAFPGFDSNIQRLQDWDMFLTMAERGRNGVAVRPVLFSTWARKGGISGTGPQDHVFWKNHILNKHRKFCSSYRVRQ